MKIKGIKKASSETQDLNKHDSRRVQVFYDPAHNDVFTQWHQGDSYSKCDDDIIDCGFFTKPASKKEIKARVFENICKCIFNDPKELKACA